MSRWFSVFLYLGFLLAFVHAAESTTDGGVVGTLKRVAKAYLHGGALPVDFDTRAERDAEDGVIRVDDSNSEKLLTSPGKDTWVIVVHGRDNDFLATAFAEAHTNVTRQWRKDISAAEDPNVRAELEHVKFGRLDYYNDWVTCTRLFINKPPYLLFVSDNNGKTEYRFLAFPPFPADGEKMYTLIKDGHWKRIKPWTSRFHPVHGDRAHLIEKYIAAWRFVGEYTKNLPVWSWIFLSMGIAGATQTITAWLFSKPPATRASQRPPARR